MKDSRAWSFDGKSLAIYGIVLLLSLLLPLVMNDLFGYFVPLFILVAGVLSLGICRWQSRKISCSFQGESAGCRRLESVPFLIVLENVSRLPCIACSVAVRIAMEDGTTLSENRTMLSLAPGESREFHVDIRFDHVGIYRLQVTEVRVHSLIGVFSFSGKTEGREASVTAGPRIYVAEELTLSEKVYAESLTSGIRSEAESIDSAGVREYEYGDPIKWIHWKLSSHTGEYVTKILESYGDHALTVIPVSWMNEDSTDAVLELWDGLLESCASICALSMEEGMETRIRCVDRTGDTMEFLPEPGENYTELIRRILPPSSSEEARAASMDVVEREASSMYASDNTVICTAVLTEELTEALSHLRASGRQVTVFFCHTGQPDLQKERRQERQIRALSEYGIACIPFTAAENAGKAELS